MPMYVALFVFPFNQSFFPRRVEQSLAFFNPRWKQVILVYCWNYVTKGPISLMTLRCWNFNNPLEMGLHQYQGRTLAFKPWTWAHSMDGETTICCRPQRSRSERPDETIKAPAHARCCCHFRLPHHVEMLSPRPKCIPWNSRFTTYFVDKNVSWPNKSGKQHHYLQLGLRGGRQGYTVH